MKYQVSCDMTFTNQADRNTVINYLLGKQNFAFIVSGDYLNIDNPISGGYRISCVYRVDAEQDQTNIYNYLLSKKPLILTGSIGFVEKHDCYHDEEGECTNVIADRWGDVNE